MVKCTKRIPATCHMGVINNLVWECLYDASINCRALTGQIGVRFRFNLDIFRVSIHVDRFSWIGVRISN